MCGWPLAVADDGHRNNLSVYYCTMFFSKRVYRNSLDSTVPQTHSAMFLTMIRYPLQSCINAPICANKATQLKVVHVLYMLRTRISRLLLIRLTEVAVAFCRQHMNAMRLYLGDRSR